MLKISTKLNSRVAITLFQLLLSHSIFSQEISNIKWDYDENKNIVTINYNIKKIHKYKYSEVTPYILFNNNDSAKLENAKGDFGKIYRAGRNKAIYWEPTKQFDLEFFKQDISFLLNANFYYDKTKELYIAYNFSETAQFGVCLGYIAKWGYYGKFKTNGQFDNSKLLFTNEYVTNYPGAGYYIIDNKKNISRFGITAGFNHRINPFLYVYAGFGYGKMNTFWHYTDYEYNLHQITGEAIVIDTKNSFKGIEVETGLICKYNSYFFKIGMNSINFSFLEGNFGLGYILFSK